VELVLDFQEPEIQEPELDFQELALDSRELELELEELVQLLLARLAGPLQQQLSWQQLLQLLQLLEQREQRQRHRLHQHLLSQQSLQLRPWQHQQFS
jgi:hypothetical protein